MVKVFHAYAVTTKRKLLFAAPRTGGPWTLAGDFDHRFDISEVVFALKQNDQVVEIIISDEPSATVLVALTRSAAAYFAAGLGPDRTPPAKHQRGTRDVVQLPPQGFQPPNFTRHAGSPPAKRRPSRRKGKAPPTSGASPDREPGSGDTIAGSLTSRSLSADHGVAADTPTD